MINGKLKVSYLGLFHEVVNFSSIVLSWGFGPGLMEKVRRNLCLVFWIWWL